MDVVALRPYRPGDWEAMYTLDVECFAPAFRFSRRVMRDFAEARDAVTVIAESHGELLGFCVVQMDGKLGYVVTLDVAAAWQRRGLARRMMQDAEAQVRSAGGEGMALHVHTGNVGAIRFYESVGYERMGMVEGFYGPGLDALVYQKKL
jgi:[ribosomal protein S18]-alanine N-acetyltransferase